MRMNVRAVYTQRLVRARSEESITEAASRMDFEEVGALPVFEGAHLVGILTERDVVRAVADGVDPSATQLGEYMTAEPLTTPVDADLSEAAEKMLELGARHLPVEDRGEVIGMISARDLLIPEAWGEQLGLHPSVIDVHSEGRPARAGPPYPAASSLSGLLR
ncbi:MAG: CBS domain-containing protein [Actinomycetota bacterium]